jgi:hypothetical protein
MVELSSITMVLVEALLAADTHAIEGIVDPLRDRVASLAECTVAEREMRGWLTGLLAVVRWTLQRLLAVDELSLPRDSQAARFLYELRGGRPRSSAELRSSVETGPSQISRVGHELVLRGVVLGRHVGKEAVWELTPRGRGLVEQLFGSKRKEPRGQSRRTHRTARKRTSAQGRGTRRRVEHILLTQAAPVKVRTVRPHPQGGWKVVVDSDGRQVARTARKSEAVQRARAILGKAGGGELVVYDRDGSRQSTDTVPSLKP